MVRLDFKKKHTTRKTIYVLNSDYVVSVGLQWTNRKIGKIDTLYQRELFKNIPCLGKFCTRSVNEGLIKHLSLDVVFVIVNRAFCSAVRI
jgi:hypothetical protein